MNVAVIVRGMFESNCTSEERGARLCHTRDLLAFICVKHRLFWRWHLDEWPDSVRDILHQL